MTAASVHDGSYICTTHLHEISYHKPASTSRTGNYLTVSRFFIEEIANSKYSFMDSSPMKVTSFHVGLRLINFRNLQEKLEKLQTHLKRRLSEDITNAKRLMRLGGLEDG
jgi:hypothetical protein